MHHNLAIMKDITRMQACRKLFSFVRRKNGVYVVVCDAALQPHPSFWENWCTELRSNNYYTSSFGPGIHAISRLNFNPVNSGWHISTSKLCLQLFCN